MPYTQMVHEVPSLTCFSWLACGVWFSRKYSWLRNLIGVGLYVLGRAQLNDYRSLGQMSYLTEFSSIAVHGWAWSVFLSALLYYPFYKVTSIFCFSEGSMTTDGDFFWTMLIFFELIIFKNCKQIIFFVQYDQFAQNRGGAFGMLDQEGTRCLGPRQPAQ